MMQHELQEPDYVVDPLRKVACFPLPIVPSTMQNNMEK